MHARPGAAPINRPARMPGKRETCCVTGATIGMRGERIYENMMPRRVISMRNVLFCAFTGVSCLSFRPVYAQDAISTPILTSAPNFRDLAGISGSSGGTGFANTSSHDGMMRTGVFYRTDALNNLSNADWATLSSLHIVRDIDLRTPCEIYGCPGPPPISPAQDVAPKGTVWTNVNIYGIPVPPLQPPFTDPPSGAVFGPAVPRGLPPARSTTPVRS
jgi:hypothetical protein